MIENDVLNGIYSEAQKSLDQKSLVFFEYLAQKLIIETPVVIPKNQNPHYWAFREGQNSIVRALVACVKKIYS